MRKTYHRSQKGVSLLLSMLALMVLTAVAVGMMYMSSTETSINSNFKGEEGAYFAARAGVEEVRDRMLSTNTSTLAGLLPTTLPTTSGGVLYVLQTGVTTANLTTFSSSNPLVDDELCHDFPYAGAGYGGMSYLPSNVRCTNLPTGGWYTTTPSVAPYPLEYKWVRVTLKANNSTPYPVDSAQGVSNQVCWNGTSEVVLPTGTASCSAMIPTANPVYMLTALALTSTGGRRIVQQEIGQTPVVGHPNDGFFATGTGCTALNIAGNAGTGSFNSATQGTPHNPPSNQTNSNGNVGANGSVSVGGSSSAVNGTISTNLPASLGSCPANGVSKSGNPTMGPLVHIASPYMPPVPAIPNPLPPTTSTTYRNATVTPGSYGNITFQGSVTMTGGTTANPAVYTMNSLSFSGNANVAITGPVVINLAGVGQSTVLSMTGGSFSNNTYLPSNFTINYGGTGSMVISGGTAAFGVINAPNATLSFHGGSNFYGSAVAATIDDQGGTNLYWDTSLATPSVANTNSFFEASLRELAY